jgi:4'-phosphopantetheinyl transferase
MPLKQFTVSLAPGDPAALLTASHNSQEVFRWSLKELSPSPDYVAAIAVEGRDWNLSCWQWTDLQNN